MDRSAKVKITKVRRSTIKAQEFVIHARCVACQRDVQMIAMSQAMTILNVSDLAFDELLAEGSIHSVQTISGNTWICKDSLFSHSRTT